MTKACWRERADRSRELGRSRVTVAAYETNSRAMSSHGRGGLEGLPKLARCGDGARRIRTADLLGAIQALCQLSYSPEVLGWEVDPIASQKEG